MQDTPNPSLSLLFHQTSSPPVSPALWGDGGSLCTCWIIDGCFWFPIRRSGSTALSRMGSLQIIQLGPPPNTHTHTLPPLCPPLFSLSCLIRDHMPVIWSHTADIPSNDAVTRFWAGSSRSPALFRDKLDIPLLLLFAKSSVNINKWSMLDITMETSWGGKKNRSEWDKLFNMLAWAGSSSYESLDLSSTLVDKI